MLYKIDEENGSISVSRSVIARIIFEVLAKADGRVFPATAKGKVIQLKQKHGAYDGKDLFEINMGDQGLDIKLSIVIRFGTSIAIVTEQLIHDIKQEVETYAGIRPNSVAIVVTGMLAKRTAPRNIEIKR
ncbi:MAG: Asp23/Gls24 family envelope stress response protein [Eubacteriales bacterium]|nr:Asp23/Gls24 family envelope stress response protein [Eubacteriales bacterium]MDD3349878.1 Asp23/Gls24 family envelope stress response protein [Eubacteriales bacterium]